MFNNAISSSKNMNRHPYLAIKAIFENIQTKELVVKYFVSTLTSSKPFPHTGNVISKVFTDKTNTNQVIHNLNKPYSTIGSLKAVDINTCENINNNILYVETELNHKKDYECLDGIHKYLIAYFKKNKQIIVKDAFTNEKLKLICLGSDKNNSNLGMSNYDDKQMFHILEILKKKHSLVAINNFDDGYYIDNVVQSIKTNLVEETDINNF